MSVDERLLKIHGEVMGMGGLSLEELTKMIDTELDSTSDRIRYLVGLGLILEAKQGD